MLQILDAISDPGRADKPNEDAFGHGGDHTWVIDGATGVADSELMGGPSDAQWLAQTASALFADHADGYGGDLKGLVRHAIEVMKATFERDATRAPNGRYELPSAAMTLMHSDGAHVTCANFADCRLVLLDEMGEARVLGDHHKDREAASKARTAKLLDRLGPDDDPFADADVMKFLRRARDYQNRADGYWILGLDPHAVDHMRSWTVPLTGPMTGLLMSDGFASLVYDYKRLTPAELVRQARDEGLESVVRTIRHIEAVEDPQMKLYPRFKRHDDATAVLMRLTTSPASD
jgi:serine/threonine protein phosphatase PrpC